MIKEFVLKILKTIFPIQATIYAILGLFTGAFNQTTGHKSITLVILAVLIASFILRVFIKEKK